MQITVKEVMDDGATLVSDDAVTDMDDYFNGALVASADGRSVPVYDSWKNGTLKLGRSKYRETQGHRPDCKGETYCDCPSCEGHDCDCEIKGVTEYVPTPLNVKAGDLLFLETTTTMPRAAYGDPGRKLMVGL